MREFQINCPASFLETIDGDPELVVLCHFIYLYENGTVVMQVPILSKDQKINVRMYDLYESIRSEDKMTSRLFRSNIIRCTSPDSLISYCIVSIVKTKEGLRIGRHYSQSHNIDHVARFIDNNPNSIKRKESYSVNHFRWNMDRLFFLRMNVTTGQNMEALVAKFFLFVRSMKIRTPCELLSQLVRFGNEQVYFYKSDFDITNGEENDYCDSAIEDTGCGDCEDSSHFITRFVNTLGYVGEILASHIITDKTYCNVICSIIKQLSQCEPRLLLCFNKEKEFHCMNVFIMGNQHLYVDSTSTDTAFLGEATYETKYGKKCFLISRMHIGISDDQENLFWNPEREF